MENIRSVNPTKCENLTKIITEIENLNWNKAKEIWTLTIMNYQFGFQQRSISFFGCEFEFFIKYLKEFQTHSLIQIFKEDCKYNKNLEISNDSDIIFFKKSVTGVSLYSRFVSNCSNCNYRTSSEIKFNQTPSFLFIQSMQQNIKINDLPKSILIDNQNYRLLCATLHKRNHFLGVFEINDNFFIVDDLNQQMRNINDTDLQEENNLFTSSHLYYLD